MSHSRALFACLLSCAALAAVGCGRQVNLIECRSGTPDNRVAACTALIQAGQDTGETLSVIYYNRGGAYSIKGDHDRAILDFNEAIRLDSHNAAAYLGRGVAFYDKRDFDRSIQDIREHLALYPNGASSFQYHGLTLNKGTPYYYLGNAYGGRGAVYANNDDYVHAVQDYEESIQDYSRAISLDPKNAQAYYGRGLVYDRVGLDLDKSDNYDRAILDYNEAIVLNPKYAAVYTSRGLALGHLGKYELAIKDLSESIRLNPKGAVAFMGRGAIYSDKGDYDRGIQDFDEALRLNPKDSVIYEARGMTYYLQSNLTAAVSDFEKGVAGAPSPRRAVPRELMLHVVMKKLGRDDSRELARVAAAADLSQWPGPLLKLYMGKATDRQVMSAAANTDDGTQKWRVCHANYFIGEYALLNNQRATALAHFKAARDDCPKWDQDYVAAGAELKRLGVPDSPAE